MYKKQIDLRKKKKFEISVLFSFYNNQHTIKKSLKSILLQTHKNFEIIICSDGSTDKSDQIVKGLIHKSDNVLFIKSNKNNGLTKSLNYMMKFTSGDYLARHDADDISHIKRLQYQVNFLKVKATGHFPPTIRPKRKSNFFRARGANHFLTSFEKVIAKRCSRKAIGANYKPSHIISVLLE